MLTVGNQNVRVFFLCCDEGLKHSIQTFPPKPRDSMAFRVIPELLLWAESERLLDYQVPRKIIELYTWGDLLLETFRF